MCALPLTAFHKLPQADGFDPTDLEASVPDEDRRLAFFSLGRGRGVLALLALTGLGLFFLPWIDITFPMIDQLTGFDVSSKLGWTWAVPAAWFVLIPTAWSRRTPRRMQSARVAVAMLAFFPGVAAATLLLRTPRGAHGLRMQFSYLWPLHGTVVVSVLAVLAAAFFGFAWQRGRPRAATPSAPASTPPPATRSRRHH